MPHLHTRGEEMVPVYKVSLVKDGEAVPYASINGPEDVQRLLSEFIGREDREHFVVVLLDTRHRVTGLHRVSVGTLNASIVHPREVFKAAILANAAAVILAHNHPSGDVTPSSEDVALTDRFVQAGHLLGIEVMDHVIVEPGGRAYSFKSERRI